MDYKYDVFISYTRAFPFGDWVQEIFFPFFKPYLANALNKRSADIFIDTEGIGPGEAWPQRLRNALAYSRTLVPIFSPEYFHSDWCKYELCHMLNRERQLGYRTHNRPEGLVLPIRIFDGENFPPVVKQMQTENFCDFAVVGQGFSMTPMYVEFQKKLNSWTTNIASIIMQVPNWCQDWINEEVDIESEINEVKTLISLPVLG